MTEQYFEQLARNAIELGRSAGSGERIDSFSARRACLTRHGFLVHENGLTWQ